MRHTGRIAHTVSSPARRLRGAARVSLSVLLAVVGLWLMVSIVAEQVIFHPRRWDVGPAPAARGWVYEDVAFKDSAGLTLRGWWIPGTSDRTVVMVHGWTSSRREPYDKSQYLHEAGYNLLVFDLRGHGRSDGGYTTMSWLEPDDVRAAVTFAGSKSAGPIALVGYSMGAATAVREAATDPRVSAVVEDSGFSSMAEVFRADFQAFTHLPYEPFSLGIQAVAALDLRVDPASVRPVDQAAQLRVPLLAIVGTGDRTVPPNEGYAIFNAVTARKQLLVVAGAGHTAAYNVDRPLYTQTVLAFLERSLPAA
jgi:uncharacterized protein